MTASPKTAAKAPKSPRKPTGVSAWFRQWLETRDEVSVLEERTATLRQRLIDTIAERGEEDEKGSTWLDLPSPVEFTDHDGRSFRYTTLKRERHLRPAVPVPDPAKAEELLEEKGLWLTPAQARTIATLQVACPYAVISVSVDVDAVAGAYFKGIISEEEYSAILVEQKESFQFRPAE